VALAASALAFAVHAQQPAGTSSSRTSTAAASSATSSQPAQTKARQGARKHTPAHRGMRHDATMARDEAGGADSAYRAALRRCVTGPSAERDTCLDQAISRYGHA
jgi:hypothetical protein